MSGRKVSEKTIRRLSHYAMCLRRARAAGTSVITSSYLSRRCGISAAAVRKDLAGYGDFGKQGSGYQVDQLLANIQEILGTCDPPPVIIVGAGNIGRALLESGLDGTGGYCYSAAFDIDPELVGSEYSGIKVRPMEDLPQYLKKTGDVIAVLAVSPGRGQEAVDKLVEAGCSYILSFTLEPIETPEDACLHYVEVSTELDILTHSMKRGGLE